MTLEEIITSIPAVPYYQTNNGVLYNADCLDIMKHIRNNSINMVLTDPPYGISFKSHRHTYQREIINDTFEDWKKILPKFLSEFKRLSTYTACCCCCAGGGGKTPATAIFTMEAIKHFNLIQTLVWRKFIGLGWRYRPAYENIVILSKDKNNYNFFDETKTCGNVIENINQDIPVEGEHPTQKPVALMEKLLLIHSLKEHVILDPFAGGGSTLVACEKLGRKWIGIEISKDYCDMAVKRIKAENDQIKMF